MSSRLNNRETGVKIVVMQRVHEKDLSGHILAESDDYEHLCLPMEYSPKIIVSAREYAEIRERTKKKDPPAGPESAVSFPLEIANAALGPVDLPSPTDGIVSMTLPPPAILELENRSTSEASDLSSPDISEALVYSPHSIIRVSAIGWVDPRAVAGEILWKERFRPVDVTELKRDVGSYGYSGQYQQSPAPEGGGMLKRGWWRYFKKLPERFDELLMSWDMSFKDSDGSSYVVGQYQGRVGESLYVLDQVRDRMDFPTTVQAVKNFVAKHPRARAKLIEDKANGPAVISTLKGAIPGIIAVQPDGSKTARCSAVSPFVEAGDCFLPDPTYFPNARWVHDFVDECALFPNGDNDDQVDAFTQGANRIFNAHRPKVVTQQQLRDAQNNRP